MGGLKYLLWRFLIALAFALSLSYVWQPVLKHNAHAAAHAQASQEAAEANQAWEQVYGHMSDREKLRGDAEAAK